MCEYGSTVLVALGANIGKVEENIKASLAALEQASSIKVLRTSSIYQTTPLGGAGEQPDYYNGAVLLETTLEPLELLKKLQSIERDLGRVRKEHWGPRCIDLDLILWGNLILKTSELTIPHPHLYWRRFVLDPASEIAPNLVVPTTGLTIEETRRLLFWNFSAYEQLAFLTRKLSPVSIKLKNA